MRRIALVLLAYVVLFTRAQSMCSFRELEVRDKGKRDTCLLYCRDSHNILGYGTQSSPALSCNDLIYKVPSTSDGTYYIIVEGESVPVYCWYNWDDTTATAYTMVS